MLHDSMLPIAEIIHLSWNTYTSKFKKYLPLAGLIFVFSVLSNVASFILIDVLSLPRIWAIIISGFASLVFALLNFGVTILIILLSDRLLDNKKTNLRIKEFLPLYWPALCISVVAGLITFGGFLLVLVPGVIFTVWYAFCIYLAVLEKKKGVSVLLKESRELSRGRFGQIFWRLVLPNAFWAIIAYLVLTGIFNLLGIFLNQSLTGQERLSTPLAILGISVSSLIAAFFSILPVIAMTIVYREAKK